MDLEYIKTNSLSNSAPSYRWGNVIPDITYEEAFRRIFGWDFNKELPLLEIIKKVGEINKQLDMKLKGNLCSNTYLREEEINPYLRLFEDDMLDLLLGYKKVQVRNRPKFLTINNGE